MQVHEVSRQGLGPVRVPHFLLLFALLLKGLVLGLFLLIALLVLFGHLFVGQLLLVSEILPQAAQFTHNLSVGQVGSSLFHMFSLGCDEMHVGRHVTLGTLQLVLRLCKINHLRTLDWKNALGRRSGLDWRLLVGKDAVNDLDESLRVGLLHGGAGDEELLVDRVLEGSVVYLLLRSAAGFGLPRPTASAGTEPVVAAEPIAAAGPELAESVTTAAVELSTAAEA